MQQLLILRHAKAVPWSPGTEDFARPLLPVGAKHARRVAAWIVANLALPERILCSPSQRTRETLVPLLRLEPSLEAIAQFVPQIYHADTHTLAKLLDAAFAEVNRVLIVGHNPSFENLIADVIQTGRRGEYSRLPTGTLAVVEGVPDWCSNGRLVHFVRGKHLSGD